jgi:microsomal dipeptidase-like Zn-dependent dipeptidase
MTAWLLPSLAVAATLLTVGAAPARADPADPYQFANGCEALKVDGKLVRATPAGYAADGEDAAHAVPFFMKAAALGHYILSDGKQKYLNAASLTSASAALDDGAVWSLTPVKGQPGVFQLYSPARRQWLSQNKQHRLNLSPNAAQAARIELVARQGCIPFPELSTSSTGTVAAAPPGWPAGTLYGIADAHHHLFSGDLFGGLIVHGKVFHRLGVTKALDDCRATHGPGDWHDLLDERSPKTLDDPKGILQGKRRFKTDGYPTFSNWPRSDALTHTLSYYKWLERAYQGGLRFLTVSLTTNGVLCRLYKAIAVLEKDVEGATEKAAGAGLSLKSKLALKSKDREAAKSEARAIANLRAEQQEWAQIAKAASCDEMADIDRGIELARSLQDYVDAQSGGPGKGWFRLVSSPQEARAVIGQGKLAAIIGLEDSNLFDCVSNPQCTKEYLSRKVDEYYKKGVRTLFTVHKFDNAFGSPNVDLKTLMNAGSFLQNGHFFRMDACPTKLVLGGTYREPDVTDLLGQLVKARLSDTTKNNLRKLLKGIFGRDSLFANTIVYPPPPQGYSHCDTGTMTDKGKLLQLELMKRGMILEADHMSPNTYEDFLKIVREHQYPFVFSHGLTHQQVRGFDTWKEPLALGGAAYPMMAEFSYPGACSGNTSQDFAAALTQHIRQRKEANAFVAVGLGSDNGGFVAMWSSVKQAHDKPGASAQCSPKAVAYPFKSFDGSITFDKMAMGDRGAVDYNSEGMTTIGQLPDALEEMRRNAADKSFDDEVLAPLFRSAEGYVRTWEKSIERSKAIH